MCNIIINVVIIIHEAKQCIKHYINALWKVFPKVSYDNLNLCPLLFLCIDGLSGVLGSTWMGMWASVALLWCFFEWKIWKGHSWVRGDEVVRSMWGKIHLGRTQRAVVWARLLEWSMRMLDRSQSHILHGSSSSGEGEKERHALI